MKYSFEIHKHGMSVKGPIPMGHFSHVAAIAAEHGWEYMDGGIAEALGATFVACSKESRAKWREELDAKAERDNSANPLLAWRHGTDVGMSAATIANAMGGTPLMSWGGSVPHDADDFGRCVRLCRRFEWSAADLVKVAERFEAWKPIIECWDELVEDFDQGDYRKVTQRLRDINE